MRNVLKMVLNHSRGHITAETASKGQKLWHFFYRALWSTGQCREGHGPAMVALLILSFVWISVSEQN